MQMKRWFNHVKSWRCFTTGRIYLRINSLNCGNLCKQLGKIHRKDKCSITDLLKKVVKNPCGVHALFDYKGKEKQAIKTTGNRWQNEENNKIYRLKGARIQSLID